MVNKAPLKCSRCPHSVKMENNLSWSFAKEQNHPRGPGIANPKGEQIPKGQEAISLSRLRSDTAMLGANTIQTLPELRRTKPLHQGFSNVSKVSGERGELGPCILKEYTSDKIVGSPVVP